MYSSEQLASLSGNKFHKKKNLFNQFLKLYPDHSYFPMTVDCVESVLKMQQEWCNWHACPGSEALQGGKQIRVPRAQPLGYAAGPLRRHHLV
jgi:hypothetical protein